MPEKKTGPKGNAEAGSLKDALMPAGHVPAPRTEQAGWSAQRESEREGTTQSTGGDKNVLPIIVGAAIVIGFSVVAAVTVLRPAERSVLSATEQPSITAGNPAASPDHSHDETAGAETSDAASEAVITAGAETATEVAKLRPGLQVGEPLTDWVDPGPMSLADMQAQRLIIDVHEHIESLAEAPLFIKAMDQKGIQTVCLMGSSEFTLTLREEVGFTGYDQNNEELLKIVKAFPGRFEAWPTLSPEDPDKLKKIQDLVARGATGVKLYSGHGYVTKKHEYMFHPVALDDPAMLPFYAWCEDNFIPIVLHVNPFKEKKGFAEEFVAVLTQFPDMKVVAPHFILSTVKSNRLEELLDTFPNLYSDISFGDYFVKERFLYISKVPHKFRRILGKYPDRFFFATDLVMIKNRKEDWAPTQFQAYIDMLTKKTYTTPAIPGETLKGLELEDDLLSRILFRNYHAFRKYRPVNSTPNGEIDWSRMSVDPVPREPGQAFPPMPKAEGGAE